MDNSLLSRREQYFPFHCQTSDPAHQLTAIKISRKSKNIIEYLLFLVNNLWKIVIMSIIITIILLCSIFFSGNLAFGNKELDDYFENPENNEVSIYYLYGYLIPIKFCILINTL